MYMTNKQISQAWPDYKQTNMYVFSFYLLQHDNCQHTIILILKVGEH